MTRHWRIGAAPALLLGAFLLVGQDISAVAQSVDEMPPGMRSAYIIGIREELIAHGYSAGMGGDRINPELARAVRDYQRDAALPVDGVLSKELLDHLKFAQPRIVRQVRVSPEPEIGDHRTLVVAIQRELQARGYYRYTVDGIVGPITRQAVRDFQADAGLAVDGRLDHALLMAMRDDYPYVRAN